MIVVGVFVLIVIGIGALIFLGVRHRDAVYAEFLDGCERDHKHYECMLLWRGTERDDPLVVPVPIVVPSTR